MSLTLTETKQSVFGDMRAWIGTVAFDSSYPTGGEALVAADVPGFQVEILAVFVGSQSSLVPTKVVSWDPDRPQLDADVSSDGTITAVVIGAAEGCSPQVEASGSAAEA